MYGKGEFGIAGILGIGIYLSGIQLREIYMELKQGKSVQHQTWVISREVNCLSSPARAWLASAFVFKRASLKLENLFNKHARSEQICLEHACSQQVCLKYACSQQICLERACSQHICLKYACSQQICLKHACSQQICLKHACST